MYRCYRVTAKVRYCADYLGNVQIDNGNQLMRGTFFFPLFTIPRYFTNDLVLDKVDISLKGLKYGFMCKLPR